MTTRPGFEAVMLSYDEPRADLLHAHLQQVLGVPVKRLHGVRGMRRAYRLTSDLVDSEQFLLADGDFDISPDFSIRDVEPLPDGVSMRVWRARNPVNGLIYGYGGLKLVRAEALRQMGEAVDVLAALPGRTEFRAEIAGVSRFNQSPFHAWKAGFRECAMLTRGSEYGMTDREASERIAAWTGSCDGEFAQLAATGAREGVAFACVATLDALDRLNDPGWLRERFASAHDRADAG